MSRYYQDRERERGRAWGDRAERRWGERDGGSHRSQQDYDRPRADYERSKPDYDRQRSDYDRPRADYDRSRPRYDRERERDRSRDRERRPADRHSPAGGSRRGGASPAPRDRAADAFPLTEVRRPLAQLRARYPNRTLSGNVSEITAHWAALAPGSVPLSGTAISVCDDPLPDLPVAAPTAEAEGPSLLDVRVLLLQLPSVPSRFLQQRLKLLVAREAGSQTSLRLYGGTWSAAADGGDTAQHETHVKVGCRHLKEQGGPDLAGLPAASWTPFLTFHKRRRGADGKAEDAKVVVLLPRVWEMQVDGGLRVQPAQKLEKYTTKVDAEEEVEEEVEEPLTEEELAAARAELGVDDAGLTEDEQRELEEKLPRTKKVPRKVTKTVQREEQRERLVPWLSPMAQPLGELRATRSYPTPPRSDAHLELLLVADAVDEMVRRDAGEAIAGALARHAGRAARAEELRRKRAAAEEERARKRVALEAARKQQLTDAEEELKLAWGEEDEGKTEDEIAESQPAREVVLKEKLSEMQAAFAAQDKAEAAAAPAGASGSAGDPAGGAVVVDRHLLGLFSLLDKGISRLGDAPREEVPGAAVQELLACSLKNPLSHEAVRALCKPVLDQDRLRYRILTDVPADLLCAEGAPAARCNDTPAANGATAPADDDEDMC